MKQQFASLTGEQLVENFRTAMVVRSTAEYAKQEAAMSEQETINGLDEISRGMYLNPTFISEASQNSIARASVDAHIKKVQASQIKEQSEIQMIELEEDSKRYIGKSVKVTVLNRDAKPIESVWFDPRSGQHYPGVLDTKSVSGTIETIMLDKNALTLRPSLLSRIGASNRKLFVVYIINPDDLEPFVSIQL